MRMTCQCCGDEFFANVGVIAHHGYRRPGPGYQTSSCMGARGLPFEASRDILGQMIKWLVEHKARLIAARQEAIEEKHPLKLTYLDYNQARAWQPLQGKHGHPAVEVEFTRASFDAVMAQHAIGIRRYSASPGTFDDRKQADLRSREHDIEKVASQIAQATRRFEGWKPTHSWDPTTKLWTRSTRTGAAA